MRDLSNDLLHLYKLKKYTVWNAFNVLLNKNPKDPEKFKKIQLLAEMFVRSAIKEVTVFPLFQLERCLFT